MRTYDAYRQMTEEALVPVLESAGTIPPPLIDAMVYSLKAGGKRIRPVLLLAACEMAGGDAESALPFAYALEMIHTSSLIHDDLPAMDNDDLRRGKPTNHKVYGEDIAILAGDALLMAAAQVMAASAAGSGDVRQARAMECILRHAGAAGMIAGQTMDVTSDGKEPEENLVHYIHEHKTADMLEAAVEAGLILGGAGEKETEAGRLYALHLGLAFQITDDLLDVKGSAEQLGKHPGKDLEQKKMTWVSLRGVHGAEEDARTEVNLAVKAIRELPWESGFLAPFAESLLNREQ